MQNVLIIKMGKHFVIHSHHNHLVQLTNTSPTNTLVMLLCTTKNEFGYILKCAYLRASPFCFLPWIRLTSLTLTWEKVWTEIAVLENAFWWNIGCTGLWIWNVERPSLLNCCLSSILICIFTSLYSIFCNEKNLS